MATCPHPRGPEFNHADNAPWEAYLATEEGRRNMERHAENPLAYPDEPFEQPRPPGAEGGEG